MILNYYFTAHKDIAITQQVVVMLKAGDDGRINGHGASLQLTSRVGPHGADHGPCY
jgi:hypothetical protein